MNVIFSASNPLNVIFQGTRQIIGGPVDAAAVAFDPSGTDLVSTDVQEAIEEVNAKFSAPAPPPSEILLSNDSVSSDAPAGTLVGILSSDATPPFVYNILFDEDDKFEITNATELRLKNRVNVDEKNSHNVTIRATDVFNQSFDQPFTISVAARPPYDNELKTQFNGIDERILIPDFNTGPNAFTISFWVTPDPSGGNRSIFNKFDQQGNKSFEVVRDNNDHINFRVFNPTNSNNQNLNGIMSVPDNVRSHVVCVFRGSPNLMQTWINATLDRADTSFPFTLANTDPSVPTYIGCRGSSMASFGQHFKGAIDELSVWNRDLSATEINELYNNGVPGNLATLDFYAADIISWWRMGEGSSGSTLKDEAEVYDGILQNMDENNYIPF